MIAISINTPMEINKKLALKRKADEHRNFITNSSKRPCYRGTIYEARLMPMPASTVLPVHSQLYQPSVLSKQVDKRMQGRLLDLLEDDAMKNHELNEFLSENSDKININEYGEDGVTPLQRLCQNGGSSTDAAEVAAILVRFGADPRLTSRDGWSAFHMASFSGNLKLVRYLMSIRSH